MRWLIVLALVLTGCATWLTGGTPVVAHGPGQIAVDSYRTADKVYIATKIVAGTGSTSKETLQSALDIAQALEVTTDAFFVPQIATRALKPAEVISDALTVVAGALQIAAADQFFEDQLRAMQPDRQTLTSEELAAIHARLLADRMTAQSAVDGI